MKGYLSRLKSQWNSSLEDPRFGRRKEAVKAIKRAILRADANLARKDKYARKYVFHFSLDPVWNLPKGLVGVNIGSQTRWGNPFTTNKYGREGAILKYKKLLMKDEQKQLRRDVKRELRGKILLCYCAPLQCHGDVLARLANQRGERTGE